MSASGHDAPTPPEVREPRSLKRAAKRVLSSAAGWVFALALLLWRLTCRYRVSEGDPRPALRAAGTPYAYALLHAHQIAAMLVNDERRMAAMVSRSADGDLLSPSLGVRRVLAVRGSTRKGEREKGGREALERLKELARQQVPVLLAVDGPRGPRNHVNRGVADLVLSVPAAAVPVCVLPSRRWILPTWDRLQVPQPFSTVRLILAPPIVAAPGEDLEALRARIGAALDALERAHDPEEHARVLERRARAEAGPAPT